MIAGLFDPVSWVGLNFVLIFLSSMVPIAISIYYKSFSTGILAAVMVFIWLSIETNTSVYEWVAYSILVLLTLISSLKIINYVQGGR